MENIPNELFQKVVKLSSEVKNKFHEQGIAIPIKNDDGTISIGNYKIIKENNFYSIVDYADVIVVDKINLPQSAIMLANSLALGKFLDKKLILKDQKFGYALFEELLHAKLIKGNVNSDFKDIQLSKMNIAKSKKQFYKRDIKQSFEKLRKLV